MKINTIYNRVLNNNFTLKHISQKEIDKITQVNFIVFLYWLDKDYLTSENGFYRFSDDKQITIYKEMAYNHYTGINYPPLFFLQCYLDLSYRQSLYLMNYYFYKVSKKDVETDFKAHFNADKADNKETPKADLQYIIKENLLNSTDQGTKANAYRRLYGYLTKRGLERFVIQNMVKHQWLMMDSSYNLCFITYSNAETKDKITAITKKGTLTNNTFKNNLTAERNTGFLYIPKNTDKPHNLFVFESCLDLFSFVQLIWLNKITAPEDFVCISLNGANNRNYIFKVLNQYPSIKNAFLCLDNDLAGIEATKIIKKQLITKNIDLRPILKKLTELNGHNLIKDWNEALRLTEYINIDLNSYLE